MNTGTAIFNGKVKANNVVTGKATSIKITKGLPTDAFVPFNNNTLNNSDLDTINNIDSLLAQLDNLLSND